MTAAYDSYSAVGRRLAQQTPAAADPALQALLDRAASPLEAHQVGWGWLTHSLRLRRPQWQMEAGITAVDLRVDQLTPKFVAGGAR